MPYARNADLPRAIRASLPAGAQTIYRKVFNNAWREYSSPQKRRADAGREETAHRVAWAAVKRSYLKRGRRWLRRPQL